MITTTQTVSWEFGGWLAGLPPGTAWTLLGAGAAIGVALVHWSYRQALVELPPLRRSVLSLLRLGTWLGLLLILAAPTRIERQYDRPAPRPLAVLVDQSGSMTTPDNRSRRRLDDALLRWRLLAPAARTVFAEPKFFAFAETVSPVSGAEEPAAVKADQTRLFGALERVQAAAPPGGWGGITVLTDGLDTGGDTSAARTDHAVQAALAAGTPLYFVPGRNRYAGGPYFTLRDFSVPDRVAPRAVFRIEATFDSFQAAALSLPVLLKVNGQARPAATLRIEPGRRLTTWSAEVRSEAPGTLDLELTADREIARATIRVTPPTTNRILYYQGALDWSYRFLADILRRDVSFALTPVFALPDPHAPLPPGALRQFPATGRELADYDLVILASVVAAQLTPDQQAALETWVRDGGVLLFLTPDDDSTRGFAGSELEKLLPVFFAEPAGADRTDGRGGGRGSLGGSGRDPALSEYAWEPTLHVREIFEMSSRNGAELLRPLFAGFAHVAGAKPGAEVLARHPTETVSDGGDHAILLALQHYGRGRSAVLTTDSLWRWKLRQPSTERGAELFWENLFAWLTRDRQGGLAFDHAPRHAAPGRELVLRVAGAGPGNLGVEAQLGPQRIPLIEGLADGDVRVFPWRPATPGFWRITATDATGEQVSHWLTVDPAAASGEYSGVPPDEALLRELADRTGGAVLESNPPAEWSGPRTAPDQLLGEQRAPLWHRGWVFGTLLGLYGLELLLRRWWKLL